MKRSIIPTRPTVKFIRLLTTVTRYHPQRFQVTKKSNGIANQKPKMQLSPKVKVIRVFVRLKSGDGAIPATYKLMV